MPYEEVGGLTILNWGDSDKPKDPKALKYIADVKKELERIKASQAGRALLQTLATLVSAPAKPKHGKSTITIMPAPEDVCNAAEEKSGTDGSVVLFSPAFLSKCSAELAPDDRSATLPHERLHHELFHALRRITGKNNPKHLTGIGNTEEFLAIMVTNIFISDVTNKHKSSLRMAWTSHHRLDAKYDESFSFFAYDTRVFNVVANFCDDNRDYAALLAHIRARFNPVAAIINHRQKAFEVAAAAMEDSAWMGLWVAHTMKEMKPLVPAKKP